jgi:predicted dehydrogenase
MISRRTFLDGLAVTAASAAVSSTAKSYAQIVGANDRLNFAVIGLNSRAYAHLASLKANSKNARISHVCDVDSVILERFAGRAKTALGYAPATDKDFRHVLSSKDVDAITIATPDHWHAPMAIDGLHAGKHVYVEKPCSHNPGEGALLVAAQKKYGKKVQMGTQRRSSPIYIDIAKKIQDGLIGRAYHGKAWYSNSRKSMGTGKVVPVPATLDWNLWQGPVPRSEYKDNIHPYNWHWLRRYGTGEALNNGTHEVDVCRWILGVEFPNRVTAIGGRYNYKDDWQFYDTLNTSFDYGDKLISWDCNSCSGIRQYGRDRGVAIEGTTGTIVIDEAGYTTYDLHGKKTGDVHGGKASDSADLTGADNMTDLHFANFIAAIQHGEKLNQPIASGNVSVTTLQLSNIAYFTNRVLNLDPSNGHIKNDPEAMKQWDRTYEKGWEPHI